MVERLTKKEKAIMRPFVEAHASMVDAVNKMSDEDLMDLRMAAASHSVMNCGFRVYEAAQIVDRLVTDELFDRRAHYPEQ